MPQLQEWIVKQKPQAQSFLNADRKALVTPCTFVVLCVCCVGPRNTHGWLSECWPIRRKKADKQNTGGLKQVDEGLVCFGSQHRCCSAGSHFGCPANLLACGS